MVPGKFLSKVCVMSLPLHVLCVYGLIFRKKLLQKRTCSILGKSLSKEVLNEWFYSLIQLLAAILNKTIHSNHSFNTFVQSHTQSARSGSHITLDFRNRHLNFLV